MTVPEVGAAAPDAEVYRGTREAVQLSAFYEQGTTVLLFFPLAFTSTCTEQMCTMAEDLGQYERLGAQVVGLSVDSPMANQRFAAECGATFPILSDFNREASRAFGILRDALGLLRDVSERAAFVIDRNGRVQYAWVGEHPGLLPPADELAAAVAACADRAA